MKNLTGIRNRALTGACLMVAIFIFLNSCSKSSNNMAGMGNNGNTDNSGGPGTNEVFIKGMAFDPSTITVTAGTTITWTNKDPVTHTVSSTSNEFDSGNITPNATFSHTFSTAGSYSYYCKIHTYMTATVKVN